MTTNSKIVACENTMKAQGIAAGFADGSFHAAGSVGRGAMAAFLFRAAGSPVKNSPIFLIRSDITRGLRQSLRTQPTMASTTAAGCSAISLAMNVS